MVLVYGWYGRGNIGDELFKDAFRYLFAKFDFQFTDKITLDLLKNASAVFFGGGSFLYAKPNIDSNAIELLKSRKIYYIGVGTETEIHETHKMLMRLAGLVATRSPEKVSELQATVNPNTFYYPDIVFALQSRVRTSPKFNKSVLVLPNIEVVSKNSDPLWKNAAWEYFKSEMSQALDVLVDSGWKLGFFPLCSNSNMNDNWAAIEVMNKMSRRNAGSLIDPVGKTDSLQALTDAISSYEVIITQRYHGIILAEMMRSKYLIIHHHDKLKNVSPGEGRKISYYGLNKQSLLDAFNATQSMSYTNVLPIESNMFTELTDKVLQDINIGW